MSEGETERKRVWKTPPGVALCAEADIADRIARAQAIDLLVHGGFHFGHGAFGPHADQNDSLEAQLSVLHLVAIGSVLGADGGLTGNAAEGVALC